MISRRAPMRLLAALLAALALVLATGTAASAAKWEHRDPAGDVRKGPLQAEGAPTKVDAANRDADITKIRVEHNKAALVVTLTTRAGLPQADWFTTVTIRTSAATYSADHGYFFGQSMRSLTKGASQTRVRCRVMTNTVNRRAHTVRLVVPRGCIGRPKWVKVGAGVITIRNGNMRADEALSRRLPENLTLSPRIAMGG